MPNKCVLVIRTRNYENRNPKRRYLEKKIWTDGKTFLGVSYEDDDGGFNFCFDEGMAKELFRKLEKLKP